MQATLVSPKLVVEDGAFFQGDCRMGEPPGGFAPAPPRAAAETASPGDGAEVSDERERIRRLTERVRCAG